MKIAFRIFILLSAIISPYYLFCQNYFELTYSTPQDEAIYWGICHSSGNVFLVGKSRTPDTWDQNPLLIKIRTDGEMETIIWHLNDTVGSFSQIIELDDGNLMLIGQCGLSSGTKYTMRWLKIIDPELNTLSDHFFRQDTSYISVYQNNAVKDNDGNVVTLGTVEFNSNTSKNVTADFFISRYSQDGDSLAFKVFPFEDHREETYDLAIIPGNGNYLAVTNAFFIGMPYPQYVNINHDFEIVTRKWFSDSYFSNPCSLNHWLTNSTFLIAGFTYDPSVEDQQIGIIKADTNAHILKSLELGKPDTIDNPAAFNSMEYVNDTTIYIGGFMNYIAFWPTEPSYIELYLVDTNLNLLGYRQFGGDINYRLYGIVATDDGGCLLYASTYSDSNNYHELDIRIFKVPRDSINIITSIATLPGDDVVNKTPYPNPVENIINIPLERTSGHLHIQIFKADGRKVFDKEENFSGNIVTLNVKYLPPGIYVYQISSENHPVASGKFIKQ